MPGFELVGPEEQAAVNEVFEKAGGVLFRHGFDVLRHGSFKVVEFERRFADAVGMRYAQAVTSGTAAVKVALKALGVRPGDEVITQCFTFVATAEAILELGATPVFTQIDAILNMDPEDLERRITPRTKAIVPVHMLGSAARMDEILAIARRHRLKVMEDTAQAVGATYRGRPLGTLGDAGAFSFDFGKALTTGEGGMVVTDDPAVFRAASEYADHGHEHNPAVPRGEDSRSNWGFNYRMMELQGAIGLVQLSKLPTALDAQRRNKARLKALLRDVPGLTFRTHTDEAGEAGDTLVFFLEDSDRARQVARELLQRAVGNKILPESLDWHYAGTWSHMLSSIPAYQDHDLEAEWGPSGKLLRRGVVREVCRMVVV